MLRHVAATGRRIRDHSIATPTITKRYATTWNRPSANVFASSPPTVVAGYRPVDVSRWCHCKIWCRTMPSIAPPSPTPSSVAGRAIGRRSSARAMQALLSGGRCGQTFRWLVDGLEGVRSATDRPGAAEAHAVARPQQRVDEVPLRLDPLGRDVDEHVAVAVDLRPVDVRVRVDQLALDLG